MHPLFLASYVLLWILLIATFVLLLGLLRLVGEYGESGARRKSVLVTDEGIPLSLPAPSFAAADTTGRSTSFPPPSRRAIAIFLSPACKPCQDLVAPLNRFWERQREAHEFFVVIPGAPVEIDAFQRLFRPAMPVVPDPDGTISSLFGHDRTPFAYLIDEQGVARIKGVVDDEQTLQALVELRGQHADARAWRQVVTHDAEQEPMHVAERVALGKEV